MAKRNHFLSALVVSTIGASLILGALVYPGCAPVADFSLAAPKNPATNNSLLVPTFQSELSVLIVGDIMLDRTVKTRTQKAKNANYPFLKIGDLRESTGKKYDLVVGNLEGPISVRRAPVKSIDFAFGQDAIPVLLKAGVSVVSQANNHALDQGRQGAQDSRAALEKGGLKVFGDQVKDDPASAMTFVEVNGKKVAFIGFNVSDNSLDRAAALNSLALAKDTADYVIVMPHWGQEYKDKPNGSQAGLAHLFIENGADAVIGSHPHWMQSIESYRGKPIVYSLGNFVFDQDWSRETGLGLAVGLSFSENSIQLKLYPVSIIESQPRFLTGKDKDARLERLAGLSDPGLRSGIFAGELKF